MDDDETTEETVDVSVSVPVVAEEEPAPADVSVVVVDAPEPPASDDAATSAAINHEGRLVALESALAQALPLLSRIAEQAENAQSTADVALDVALTPEPEPEPEPDEEPVQKHFMHKSFRELIGGKS